MSHWAMLKMTTKKGKNIRLTPAKDIITVKNSVDNPMMSTNVPIKEKRSFHKLTKLSSTMLSERSGL